MAKIKSESRETTPPQSTLPNAENERIHPVYRVRTDIPPEVVYLCALRGASFTCMDSCGGRKKFNVKFIVKTDIFLYNRTITGVSCIVSSAELQ